MATQLQQLLLDCLREAQGDRELACERLWEKAKTDKGLFYLLVAHQIPRWHWPQRASGGTS